VSLSVKLVEYECVAPDHQERLERPDKLTVHDGRWAFCPCDTHENGHVWKLVDGDGLSDLQRRVGIALARTSERIAS
jgi:hypothetical protein